MLFVVSRPICVKCSYARLGISLHIDLALGINQVDSTDAPQEGYDLSCCVFKTYA